MPAENSDWRLTAQQNYLHGVCLWWKKYTRPRESWDHDHCAFCWAKFSEDENVAEEREGFASEGNYHWICNQCFEDFKESFEWRVIDPGPTNRL